MLDVLRKQANLQYKSTRSLDQHVASCPAGTWHANDPSGTVFILIGHNA